MMTAVETPQFNKKLIWSLVFLVLNFMVVFISFETHIAEWALAGYLFLTPLFLFTTRYTGNPIPAVVSTVAYVLYKTYIDTGNAEWFALTKYIILYPSLIIALIVWIAEAKARQNENRDD